MNNNASARSREAALIIREVGRAHLDVMRGVARDVGEALRHRANKIEPGRSATALRQIAQDLEAGHPLEHAFAGIAGFQGVPGILPSAKAIATRPIGELGIGLLDLAFDVLDSPSREVRMQGES